MPQNSNSKASITKNSRTVPLLKFRCRKNSCRPQNIKKMPIQEICSRGFSSDSSGTRRDRRPGMRSPKICCPPQTSKMTAVSGKMIRADRVSSPLGSANFQ